MRARDYFCPSMKLKDLNLHKTLLRKIHRFIIQLINIHTIYFRKLINFGSALLLLNAVLENS